MSPPASPSPSADGTAAADRALGRRLAERIAQLGPQAAARLRTRLPELVGPESNLLAPLQDLVGRPAFQRLLASEGGRQRALRRQGLNEDLRQTYSEGMSARLDAVLEGLLEALPAGPRQEPVAQKGGWLGLVALTAAITLGSGVLFAVVRSNLMCPSFGLCLPGSGGREAQATVEDGLERASRDANALENAGSLEAYTAALEQLDTSLLDLVSRRLTPRQEQKRQRLQSRADAGHRSVREEQRAQRSLEEATALIDQLERNRTAGPQRLDALAEAQARLDAVPKDSFARSAARELEGRLRAVRDNPATPAPAVAPPAGEAPPAPVLPEPQAPRPAPAASPAPAPAATPPPPPPVLPPPPPPQAPPAPGDPPPP